MNLPRLGWIVGFTLILLAAVLGIAGQIFWLLLSAGVGLIILGLTPIVSDLKESIPMILCCALVVNVGAILIALALVSHLPS